MVTGFLLDTDIVITALKGKLQIGELVYLGKQAATTALSVITVFEIWEGIQGSKKIAIEDGEQQFNQFIEEYVEQLIPVDLEIAKCAGKVRAGLRQKGEIITDTDILIAATCIVNGLTLVTKNKRHFGRIKDLSIF